MKKYFLICCILLAVKGAAFSQILKPVTWSYSAKLIDSHTAIIYIKAKIDAGWHLYSQHVEDGGPVKTSFDFEPSRSYVVLGETVEPTPISKFEPVFTMKVSYFEKEVTFRQKVRLLSKTAIVKGSLHFMSCNDKQCLTPSTVDFAIPVH